MKSVFVSYSSRDNDEVKTIVRTLEANKISYFKAPESIPAGSNYAREIPAAIRECSVFLLVISRSSEESIWVEKEIDCAINLRKLIIPVKLFDGPLSDIFMFYLNNVQIINYFENRNVALQQLALRLEMFAQADVNAEDVKEVIRVNDTEATVKPKQSSIEDEINEIRRQNATGAWGVRYHDNSLEDESANKTISGYRSYARKMNAISVNKMPLECIKCGGDLVQVHRGTFRCVNCGYHNYDSYQLIRNYLAENGAKPAITISADTGVPRRTVEYFLLEESLEIPSNSPIMLSCSGCGAPIRTGRLCERCKQRNVKLNDEQLHSGPQYHYATHNNRLK